MSRRLCVTGDEAEVATKQHTKPCGDCPWRRDALKGWLGSMTADQWLRSAHGEDVIECHTLSGAQCAGSGIYRGNICKQPRDRATLRLPADRVNVFASPAQFKDYHEGDDAEPGRGFCNTDRKIPGTRLRHPGKGRTGTLLTVSYRAGGQVIYKHNAAETYRDNWDVVRWIEDRYREVK